MSEKRSSLHKGNIFDSSASIICHQVNCQGVMGAGLAKEVKARFPEVFNLYKQYCDGEKTEYKLGMALIVPTDYPECQHFIANCFGQDKISTTAQATDYDALKRSLESVVRYMQMWDLTTVAIPYGMGCGLGGGDWKVVRQIISDVFGPTNLFVEIWQLDK